MGLIFSSVFPLYRFYLILKLCIQRLPEKSGGGGGGGGGVKIEHRFFYCKL